jgi:hypothetical protein
LVKELGSYDISGWMDAADLSSGQLVSESLRTALRDSACVILIVSPAAMRSNWLSMELGAALSLQKPIIPIVVGDPVKSWGTALSNLQWIDARKTSPRETARQVSDAMKTKMRA